MNKITKEKRKEYNDRYKQKHGKLCPYCKKNKMYPGAKQCDECRRTNTRKGNWIKRKINLRSLNEKD